MYSPGNFLFNGLQINEEEDGCIVVDANQKLQGIHPIHVDLYRDERNILINPADKLLNIESSLEV